MVDRIHRLRCARACRVAPSGRGGDLFSAARGAVGEPLAVTVAFAELVSVDVPYPGPANRHSKSDRGSADADAGADPNVSAHASPDGRALSADYSVADSD